jgi:hypothetical protein
MEEGFISANLLPTNSSEWVSLFWGETTNVALNQQTCFHKRVNEARHMKHNKFLGSSTSNLDFTLGNDLTLSRVAKMANKTLLGKA